MNKLLETIIAYSACIIWDIYLLNTAVGLINERDNWKWIFILVFLFTPEVTPDKEKEKSKIITEEKRI